MNPVQRAVHKYRAVDEEAFERFLMEQRTKNEEKLAELSRLRPEWQLRPGMHHYLERAKEGIVFDATLLRRIDSAIARLDENERLGLDEREYAALRKFARRDGIGGVADADALLDFVEKEHGAPLRDGSNILEAVQTLLFDHWEAKNVGPSSELRVEVRPGLRTLPAEQTSRLERRLSRRGLAMRDGGEVVTLYNYKETWPSLSRLFRGMGVEWALRDPDPADDEESE